MAKVLKVTKTYDPLLYDSQTGKNCIPLKVVDVTEDCPKVHASGEKCIFVYTREKRGLIVQISRPYPDKVYEGLKINFLVGGLEREMKMPSYDCILGLWADELGLTKEALVSLIKLHAPPA